MSQSDTLLGTDQRLGIAQEDANRYPRCRL
jgi:hypothetical protein